ncbi:hypothetical protein [Rickettsiella endosymbiont of Miltochrista miniata]|uniref:hypothetical protein n=1 Tax=Rickettsiella endosymbiont of Miltochrista miniata TaxID=3066239 RepID=UPI00313AD805
MPLKNKDNFSFVGYCPPGETTVSHPVNFYIKDKNESSWAVKSLATRLQRSIPKEEQIKTGFIETIAGEIARLVLGSSQPKTRLMEKNVENNTAYFVLSKEIPEFNELYFCENKNYYKAIQSKEITGLGGVLVLALWLDDIDVKQRGNIGVNDSGQVVKIDWDCSLNDMHKIEPDPQGMITAEDIKLLPNIANFHAYQWLSFVTEGCNEAILKIIIDSAPMLDDQYPQVSQQQFDQSIKTNPRNTKVFDEEVRDKINLIADCIGKVKVGFPVYNLLRFFLVKRTPENLQQKLDLMQKNASEITELDSFRLEVNQTILRIILLPESLIEKFSQCYVPDDSEESSQLASKIIKILIERQQQLIQAVQEVESFHLYMGSKQAEDDIRSCYISSINSFKTMGKSFLVEETESDVLKDKIRIKFKKFKNDFAATTNKMDNPSGSHQTFFSSASSSQQPNYPSSSHTRRFGS